MRIPSGKFRVDILTQLFEITG